MLRKAPLAGALCALVLFSSCDVFLTQFFVPSDVPAGETFEVVVQGSFQNESYCDSAAATLQIPNGFQVLSAWVSSDEVTLVQNDPAVLSMYQPEPGHFLVSYSAQACVFSPLPNPLTLRVLLRAPAATGNHTFKVSLAATTNGNWHIDAPLGVNQFSQIAGQPLAVVAPFTSQAPTYQLLADGLPAYDTDGWGGVAFGDVDGDGLDDVACIARLGDGPHVFLSTGTGFVEASAGLTSTSGRSDVVFADFNADGFLDLADGNGRAYLGNGGLSWTQATVTGIKAAMEGVATGDVDNDGFDDVAFSGHFDGFVQCYLGSASGTFTESSTGLPNMTVGSDGGHKLLMMHANGDANLDIVWTRYHKPGVWLGDGSGTWFEVPNEGFGDHQFWGAEAYDFDGDGDQDVVFGVYGLDPAQGGGGGGIQLYENNGGALFTLKTGTGLPTTGEFQDLALGDFDRDGLVDIVAGASSFGAQGQGAIQEFLATGPATFALSSSTGLPDVEIGNPEGLAVGDVNGDTWPDIGYASYGMGTFVLRNDRTGFSSYGEPCNVTLTPIGPPPQVGSTGFGFAVNGPALAPGLFFAGIQKTALEVPNTLGCELLVQPIVQFPVQLGPTGSLQLVTGVPNLPSLAGLTVFTQVGLQAPLNPAGLVFSNGGAVKFSQ